MFPSAGNTADEQRYVALRSEVNITWLWYLYQFGGILTICIQFDEQRL